MNAIMEKKEYIKPEVEVIDIDSVQMLCASNQFDITDTPTDNDAVMSNRHRGTWGNLWADDESK